MKPSKKKPRKLTDKEIAFCREYCMNGWNATQAAIRAGYSENSARQIATVILSKVYIQERVQYHKTHLEELLNISKEKIIREHQKLAFSSIAHLHNTWIEQKQFEELTDDQRECIQEIFTKTEKRKVDEETFVDVDFVKIKLYDKQKSLDSISKIMGYDAAQKIDLSNGVIQFSNVSKQHPNE